METTAASKVMGKDEFLRLFTTQLKYQDPLKPMDGTEFTTQLAQFSSLEQLMNMNQSLLNLTAYQQSLNSNMAVSFIGKTVKTAGGDTGKVMGVTFQNGLTYLMLDSGKNVTLGELQEISS